MTRYLSLYFLYLKAFIRWHLRLTRSRPGYWFIDKADWQTSMRYYRDRKIWGPESKLPLNTWYRQTHRPRETFTEYFHYGSGSAGKGEYFFEIPIKGWKL